MFRDVGKFLAKLQSYVDRPWYLPAVAFVIGLDLYILIIPSDGLLISSVLMRPKKWVRTALWLTTGSAVGAVTLAALLQWDSDLIMNQLFPFLFQTEGWGDTEQFMKDYGFWALAFIALSIFPQQPAVVVAALGGMSLPNIFLSIWLGRAVKYGPLAAAAAYAPRYLGRVWFIRKELEALKNFQEAPEKKQKPSAAKL